MVEQTRAEFQQRLAKKAAVDPEFRAFLLRAPKEAIESFLEMDMPEELNFVVHQEDAETLHLVLPMPGEELSPAELASVSGGLCWSHCVYVSGEVDLGGKG